MMEGKYLPQSFSEGFSILQTQMANCRELPSVGSNWEVSYVWKQGSQTTKYRGYPDYFVRKDSIGASFVLVAVRETQTDRKDAVMQEGTYTVGQFQKINTTTNPATWIALHKNKMVNVMVAKLD